MFEHKEKEWDNHDLSRWILTWIWAYSHMNGKTKKQNTRLQSCGTDNQWEIPGDSVAE